IYQQNTTSLSAAPGMGGCRSASESQIDLLLLWRNYYNPSFPPQPQLVKTCNEQVEEEGANEEIEALMINKGHTYNVIDQANRAKVWILKIFFDQSNPQLRWHEYRYF
ncbi:MAG: hypothetical protein EZS28_042799, partial [Streblomastix strix]